MVNIPKRNLDALTNFILHLQQQVVLRHVRLNVRIWRPVSQSTSSRRREACWPR